jgi:hypothetical protein
VGSGEKKNVEISMVLLYACKFYFFRKERKEIKQKDGKKNKFEIGRRKRLD